MRIGIIGATGWLGSALGKRLLELGLVVAEDLVLLNRSGPRPEYHGHDRVIWAKDATDLARQVDVVVLSVRPQDWPALDLRAEDRLVLSFMAGVRGEALRACGGRVVRVMPNAAAEIGQSYSPWWAASKLSDADRAAVTQVLSAIGTSDELASEDQINLMTALPGSGAAYPALMAVAMAGFLRERGVAEQIAWRSAEAAVCGGAQLLAGRIAEAPAMVAAYRDYRGVTAAGLEAAEEAGFSRAILRALEAATEAARRLG